MVKFLNSVIYSILISICCLGGSWSLDIIFNADQDPINKQIAQSFFTGITTTSLWVFWNKIYPKRKAKNYKKTPLLLLMLGMLACRNNSPIKISKVNGNEFISCNVDKVKDTNFLKMSEIAESCEIVFLESDSTLIKEDYQLGHVTVSDNFIVVMPEKRPALLYSRTGMFIKRLDGEGKLKYLWAINSQIDKNEYKVYIQVPGLNQLYVFGLKDNSFKKIDWAIKHTYDFVFADSITLYGVIHDKENWGYLQFINVSVPNLVRGKSSNILYPYFSSVYQLLLEGNKIVFDCHQDTTYYYNPINRKFTPFLYCYSEKNDIDPERILRNISSYGVDYEKITDGKPFYFKRLLYASNGYYIFSISKQYQDEKHILTINKYKNTTSYTDTLINDFFGNCKVAFMKSIIPYYQFNNKDGYLTYHYNRSQFTEEICGLDVNSLDALKNNKEFSNVLFINKLKP